ncbi:MAG: phage integrase family protein [Haloplasmataceae bacterium]|jgi:integrase|nr:phage integrase family protein [Haloplasmataceae bacterium]
MNSLIDNFNYAITQNTKFGAQKHSIKKTDKDHTNIYSLEDAKGLRDTAKNFCNYMKENHSEITQIKKIKKEHIQEWIDKRSVNWSNKTMECHLSHIQKLERVCKNTYQSCYRDFSNVTMPYREKQNKVRDVAMDKEDIQKLRDHFSNRTTECKLALEIECRLGLRSLELSLFRGEYIDINNKCVNLPADNLSGTKGKRGRTISINEKDIYFFSELQRIVPNGRILTISEDALNKGFRRALKDLDIANKYPKTTIHAMRKAWATERYNNLLELGHDDSIKTFDIISKELGHGENRHDLYKTYIVK